MSTSNQLRDRFFEHGLQILGDEGYAGLKLIPLCESLGITTGAFYHSFANWKDYTDQLLDNWHTEQTTRLIEIAERTPDPIERLEVLLDLTVELPHRAESAIRAWSIADSHVATIQKSVDQERHNVVYPAFLELVGDPELADHFSRAGIYLLVGFEQAESQRRTESLVWALNQLKDAAASRREGNRQE